MEVVVDVERIIGRVQSTGTGSEAKTLLGQGHEGEEVGNVGAVEGLSKFGDDEFAPARDLGGHNAGAIAPVKVTEAERLCGNRVARWGEGIF